MAITYLGAGTRIGLLGRFCSRFSGFDRWVFWKKHVYPTYRHNTLGKRNILRINVYGDPATQVPRKGWGYSYRSIGMLVLDAVERVDQRILSLGLFVPEWADVKGWAGRYHYGFARDGSLGFHWPIVMPQKELLDGLEAGRTGP